MSIAHATSAHEETPWEAFCRRLRSSGGALARPSRSEELLEAARPHWADAVPHREAAPPNWEEAPSNWEALPSQDAPSS